MAKKENRHAEHFDKLSASLVSASANIEAPYELPEGWKWEKISNLSDIYTGNSINETVKKEKYTGIKEGLNFIGTKDVDFDGTINYENGVKISDYENFKTVPANTPLLCIEGGSAGKKLGITSEQVCFGNKLCAFVCKNVEPKLVYYYLQTNAFFYSFIKERHGLIGGVSVGTLKNIPFPLPPTLAEQQRIVNRIETMFAKLDHAQKKAQSVLDSFETRKAAILHKAFSGQLRIDNEELTIADWEDTTIGECCKLGSGGTPLKSHPEYYENGNIPWLKTGEIDWNDIYDVEEKITNAGVENSSAKIFPAESVVVAMYGMGVTRGKAAIIKIPTTTNQAVCVLQPNEKLNNRFLFYYFMCNYWQVREQSVGGNQLNLSGKIIAGFPIKFPPLNYQLSIVNFLDTVLEKESRAKEAAQNVLDQIALLKKSILARAFRGEL